MHSYCRTRFRYLRHRHVEDKQTGRKIEVRLRTRRKLSGQTSNVDLKKRRVGWVVGKQTENRHRFVANFKIEIEKQVKGSWLSGQAFGGVENTGKSTSGVRRFSYAQKIERKSQRFGKKSLFVYFR